jgi:hypothetical protein
MQLSLSPKALSPKQLINSTIHQWNINKLRRPFNSHVQEHFSAKRVKPKRQFSSLQDKLKLQHRTSKHGTQILNLPKRPFGKHDSYNSELEFSRAHFVAPDCLTPTRRKVLTELSHKFRLLDKRKRQQNKLSKLTLLTSSSNVDVLPISSGELTVTKELQVIKAYETQKAAFLGITSFAQTNRELEGDSLRVELKRRISAPSVDKRTAKLHNARHVSTTTSKLAQKFDRLLSQ